MIITCQIAVAKLPLAKEIEEFVFDEPPINETLASPPATSSPSATSCRSAAREPERPTSPALESAGVEFIERGDGGPGVRLRT